MTQPMTESHSTSEGGTSASGGAGSMHTGTVARQPGSMLVTDRGRTIITDTVVEKIAGMAARQVSGVHALGRGASRAMGALRDRLPVGGSSPASQGVSVEVGERQAAVDLDVVADYGVSMVDLTQAIRRNVIQQVEGMTGLEVTEVNITVDDVFLGETEEEEPRVQ
jgi:uncharacterized alkaline shock family protein YloU